MSAEPAQILRADLKGQREAIQRELTRTTTAGAAIMLVVILLAATALYAALRADRNARAAVQASGLAESRLWNAYLAQARSSRLSGQAGRRTESLTAITAAASIRQSPALKREAIAALALTDLRTNGPSWQVPRDAACFAFDANLERFAYAFRNGEIRIY